MADRRNEKITGNYHTREELETAVKRWFMDGVTYADISSRVGVSEGTVHRILKDTPDGRHMTAEQRDRMQDAPLRYQLHDLWLAPDLTHLEEVDDD